MTETGERRELQQAAVMFPRLFLWLIGAGIFALMSLAGIVVGQHRGIIEETRQKVDRHDAVLAERGTKIQLLEQATQDLKATAAETRQDVKEIRRLIEERLRRGAR